ncbi:flagellin N-terminal helical domain-containing protein [Aureimonas psammosilenae]|uniref:flagellin N-terminal helical domain-containing protein n=1 Tax=Aureimonas psammosilenae TaxID=2495496 RepID=UPI001260952C|nr:flagellin [Aureimonas psammosilenae]
MASVNTNAAAITALRTLQQTNTALDKTQNKISTGYKIGEAKDNAAYWSISTTLKSDNKALSTVKDALGLGASTVDTAYQGLNKAKDVLDEIKSKLTAATQDGVDKTKIQTEIGELQKQLVSIASSSVFSGENWLSVDSSANGYNAAKGVVSSFTRLNNGTVNIGTINIDTSNIALFDSNTQKQGILDGGKSGNADAGTIVSATSSAKVNAAAEAAVKTTAADFSNTTLLDGKTVSFDLTVDNRPTQRIEVAATTANRASATTWAAAVQSAVNAKFGSGVLSVVATKADGTVDGTATNNVRLTFTSATSGATSRIVTANYATTDTTNTSEFGGLSTAINDVGADATYKAANAVMTSAFSTAVTLDADDTIAFSMTVDGGSSKVVTISKALVDSTLGAGDGKINNATQMKSVLTAALSQAGITGVSVGVGDGAVLDQDGNAIASNKLYFANSSSTATSKVTIGDLSVSKGTNITTLDITGKTATQISQYIQSVNTALNRVTTAAATLGSVASRIDMQKSFVDTLMDTIDKGVGNLVDADMSEESTKLQALQVKQQLGVQALSIANQASQNILSLFRS